MGFLIIVATVVRNNDFCTMGRRRSRRIGMQTHEHVSSSSDRPINALCKPNIFVRCASHEYRYAIISLKFRFAVFGNAEINVFLAQTMPLSAAIVSAMTRIERHYHAFAAVGGSINERSRRFGRRNCGLDTFLSIKCPVCRKGVHRDRILLGIAPTITLRSLLNKENIVALLIVDEVDPPALFSIRSVAILKKGQAICALAQLSTRKGK